MLTWKDVIGSEKEQDYFKATLATVREEREAGKVIYPPATEVFNAFKLTELDSVKVVILGQDPYHGPSQAHGLCFSVLPGVRVRGAQFVGTLLGLVAAIVLVTRGSGIEIQPQYLPGYRAALAAAVIWAAYSVLNRRHAAVPSAAITVACALVAVFGAMAHLGFEQSVPRLNFIGRSGWYSDLCGEKLNEAFVRNAMLSVDARLPEHGLLQGVAMPQPHYRLLAADTDAAWLNADVCAALDSALHANPQYAHARRIGQLHPLRLHWVADIPAHAAALARPEQRLATRKIALLLPPQTA